MKDKMAEFIKNTLNSDIPYVPWLTGYVATGAVWRFLLSCLFHWTFALKV
jgi:hypothetical protein